jgi:hypothetical protein
MNERPGPARVRRSAMSRGLACALGGRWVAPDGIREGEGQRWANPGQRPPTPPASMGGLHSMHLLEWAPLVLVLGGRCQAATGRLFASRSRLALSGPGRPRPRSHSPARVRRRDALCSSVCCPLDELSSREARARPPTPLLSTRGSCAIRSLPPPAPPAPPATRTSPQQSIALVLSFTVPHACCESAAVACLLVPRRALLASSDPAPALCRCLRRACPRRPHCRPRTPTGLTPGPPQAHPRSPPYPVPQGMGSSPETLPSSPVPLSALLSCRRS